MHPAMVPNCLSGERGGPGALFWLPEVCHRLSSLSGVVPDSTEEAAGGGGLRVVAAGAEVGADEGIGADGAGGSVLDPSQLSLSLSVSFHWSLCALSSLLN